VGNAVKEKIQKAREEKTKDTKQKEGSSTRSQGTTTWHLLGKKKNAMALEQEKGDANEKWGGSRGDGGASSSAPRKVSVVIQRTEGVKNENSKKVSLLKYLSLNNKVQPKFPGEK